MRKIDVSPAVVRVASSSSLSAVTDLMLPGASVEGLRRVENCRVVVLRGVVLIVMNTEDGLKLVFRERVLSESFSDGVTYIETVPGKTLAVIKDSSCGCGSRLKSWNPYTGLSGG